MYMCVKCMEFAYVSTIVRLDFGAGRTLWYLLEQVEHCDIYWSR